MKTYRMKEQFLVTKWTYVKAKTKKDAVKKLEDNEGTWTNDEGEWEEEYKNTFWETLKEVKKNNEKIQS